MLLGGHGGGGANNVKGDAILQKSRGLTQKISTM